jgi:tRNA threonylcarbamoyladenosine biosynthesis protein TsaE
LLNDKFADIPMKEKMALVEIESESAEQTFAIGFAVGEKAGEGDIFALSGELARGLGVGENYTITSPTFTLINEYPGRYRFYHFDVYRLNRIGELDDLGYDEYVSGKGVVAIEWAEKIANALPPDAVSIKFIYVDENKRTISISGPQERVQDLLKDIKREV